METITILFQIIISCGVIIGGFIYGVKLLLAPMKTDISRKFDLIQKDISQIKENLSNHITDTNKKIDDLKKDLKDGQAELKEMIKALQPSS